MIKIGVTGGIGSGKTVVCELLRIHGVPVFDADKEAKRLNDSSQQVREALIHHFGNELYDGKKLNRKRLADLIFNDKRNLEVTNSIIHPALAEQFMNWCAERTCFPFVAIDAAVLFEANFDKYVDSVVAVYSPKEIRIDRVMKRDHTDRNKVVSRMKSQISEEEKKRMADHVILNDGHFSLIQQVDELLTKLQKLTRVAEG